MGKYFTVKELCKSDVAVKHRIDNTPPPAVKVKLNSLISNLLDPVRERWGRPIRVNSGFRCPVLNGHEAIGGAVGSQHIRGEAADITAGDRADNKRLFELIVSMQKTGELRFDQLIDERDYLWLHVSYSSVNRGQVLHI